MPTYYLPDVRVIAFDENAVYPEILSNDGADEQICSLRKHSEYIALPRNIRHSRSPFFKNVLFNTNSSHLEIVHQDENDNESLSIFRIIDCGNVSAQP
jgi:hypothetical protein